MPKYTAKRIERAHWWMAKAVDSLSEAKALIPTGSTRRGAYNRLFYASHHIAVALLRLIGNKSRTHKSIIRQFGLLWVQQRRFPKFYGGLLNQLHSERGKADYGEYVPTKMQDLEKRYLQVERFLKRAWKEIPAVSTEGILNILVDENDAIRDFSFDIYCPKSYFHHTRMTFWTPKGRADDEFLQSLLSNARRMLKNLGIEEQNDYVLGLNSKVNQYEEMHLLMLDFDDVSTLPYDKFRTEPGFFFRTENGFHFLGAVLYGLKDWRKRMRKYSKLASRDHCNLSIKRGYGTLRLTSSNRKPGKPAYIGRTEPSLGK
jgi:uncharacterized protein (UPF0332 family)